MATHGCPLLRSVVTRPTHSAGVYRENNGKCFRQLSSLSPNAGEHQIGRISVVLIEIKRIERGDRLLLDNKDSSQGEPSNPSVLMHPAR